MMPFLGAALAVAAASSPLTLDQSVALALLHHPSARVATFDREIANEKAATAGLATWPELDLQSGALYTTQAGGAPAFVANNAPMESRVQLVARVPVDTGQLAAARRQAELEAASQGHASDAAIASLALGVGQAYYDELRAERAVEAVASARDGAEAQRTATAVQLSTGKLARLDLRRAEAAVAAFEANLAGARADLAIARRHFRDLTGAPTDFRLVEPGPPPPPAPSLAIIHVATNAATDDLEDAIRRRPEVRQAESDLDARRAEADAARLARRPQIGVTTVAGWDTAGALQASNAGGSLGLDIGWPVWDAGKLTRQERTAELGVARATAALHAAVLAARTDLEDARDALAKAQVQYVAQARARAVADEALAMARVGFREGAVAGLDLIAARQAAFAARVAQENAVYDYRVAAWKLRYATGMFAP